MEKVLGRSEQYRRVSMISRELGLALIAGGVAHLVYLFYKERRSFFRWVDIAAVLFGAALWQYPEKTNEIVGKIISKLGG
jgi:uncharacterized membrane protein HdeD (DUF308 family)